MITPSAIRLYSRSILWFYNLHQPCFTNIFSINLFFNKGDLLMILTAKHTPERKISGYKSPGNDYAESRIRITEHLDIHPDYPVYFQMDSLSMKHCGLLSGDILVVDRALRPVNNAIVVALVDSCYYCRRYAIINNKPVLTGDEDELYSSGGEIPQICGVVTSVCRHTLPPVLRMGNYRRICTL